MQASPEDFRSWLLLSQIQRVLGNDEATGAYLTRAVALAPYVLARISSE